MGVYTYVSLYKKDNSYIKSENSVLGIFQVDYEEKEKFQIVGETISFYFGIRSLDKLEFEGLSKYEVFETYFELFTFYALASDDYGEATVMKGDRVESLLFEPSRALKGINILLNIIEYFDYEVLNELNKHNEIEKLESLRNLLIKAVETDALIGCATT